jgi:hypothetical protein
MESSSGILNLAGNGIRDASRGRGEWMGTGVGRIESSSLDREGDFGSYFSEFGYRNGVEVLSGAVVKDWGKTFIVFGFRKGFRRDRYRL